jgi:hypothetical protein
MTVQSIVLVGLLSFCSYCFATDEPQRGRTHNKPHAATSADFTIDAPQYNRAQMKTDDTRIVGMECHKKKQTLEVAYFTAYNIPDKLMDLWDTFALKENSEDGMSVKAVHEVIRNCNIGADHYVVKFRPIPGNWNLNRECGGDTYGGAKILKNEVLVFDSDFEKCRSEEVITRVFFSSGAENPEITKISNHEFVFGKHVSK